MGGGRGEEARRGRRVGGGVAVAAPLHLPRAGVHQGPQAQGVPAAGGVAGALPPRRPRAAPHGGAQAPGAAAPAAAGQEAAGGVRGRRRGGRRAAGERVPGPRRRVARRRWEGAVPGDDDRGRVLPAGGDEGHQPRRDREEHRGLRAQRPHLQPPWRPLHGALHPPRHAHAREPAAAATAREARRRRDGQASGKLLRSLIKNFLHRMVKHGVIMQSEDTKNIIF
jgi:hypothetical protein